MVFLDAPGGCGKSFVVNAIFDSIWSHQAPLLQARHEKIVLPMASLGIAALLLTYGTTAHSQLKIPIPILARTTYSLLIL
jgi:hypothetical protein